MQICTSLQTDNYASTPPLSFFTGQMPFLPTNQQRQSTEGQHSACHLGNTRSSAITEGPRNASCQLKSCQLPRNSAETTCTKCPEQIEVMKLEGYPVPMCNKHANSTMMRSSRFHCLTGVINELTTVELCISPVYRRHAVAKFSKSTMLKLLT